MMKKMMTKTMMKIPSLLRNDDVNRVARYERFFDSKFFGEFLSFDESVRRVDRLGFQLGFKPLQIEREVLNPAFAKFDVGMANILWHHLSFTVRSHTRPYAIIDPNNSSKQLLCGRIMALNGDFAVLTEDNPLHDVPELLEHEVASLYVPAKGDCSIALVDDEALIPCPEDQVARLFVEHCLLMACTGDMLHEQQFSDSDLYKD